MGERALVMPTVAQNTNKAEPAQTPLDSPTTFADFILVSPQCVRNWCHDGTIPLKFKAGRIIRFEREAALRALEAKEAGAATQKEAAR